MLMMIRYSLLALSLAGVLALGGCASPSPQACMLVGACASQTTRAQTHQAPTAALTKVCFAGPAVQGSMPLTIKAVSRGGSGIGEPMKKSAQESAKSIVEVYGKETGSAVLAKLQALGVNAAPCSGAETPDVGRLVTSVAGITTDTGGLGWKTQLDIHASLQVGPRPSTPVWTASFVTGNRSAVGMAADRENVDAFASNLVDEIGRSGWIARR